MPSLKSLLDEWKVLVGPAYPAISVDQGYYLETDPDPIGHGN